jgi:hypothetical protein
MASNKSKQSFVLRSGKVYSSKIRVGIFFSRPHTTNPIVLVFAISLEYMLSERSTVTSKLRETIFDIFIIVDSYDITLIVYQFC